MKVPNGSDDVFEWVEIEKSVTIIRNPPYDNSDILKNNAQEISRQICYANHHLGCELN